MNLFTLLFNREKAMKYFLEWQKAVSPNTPDHLVMNFKQLKAWTATSVKNDQRIINDCVEILEKTTKPDTFFSRFGLLTDKVAHLSTLAEYASEAGYKPKYLKRKCATLPLRYNYFIEMFLSRYYSETVQKAEILKTEKGRNNKYQKFYDSLQEYYSYMTEEHIDFIETKYRLHTNH